MLIILSGEITALWPGDIIDMLELAP